MTDRTNTPLYVSATAPRRPLYRAEVINRRLVYAMFTLALATLAFVTFAVVTDRPHVGQPKDAAIVFERTITLNGEGNTVTVRDDSGAVLLDTDQGGFVAVVIDGLERARTMAEVEGNPPVTVTQFENGRLSLYDESSDTRIELASFGGGNLGVWKDLVTP